MKHEVYIHTCRINGKSYIGITNKTASERFIEHCLAAKRGSKFAFHAAIRKHGEDQWIHETLAVVKSREEAHRLEIELISERRTTERQFGYNMTKGGDGVVGLTRTQEHSDNISKALQGHEVSEETRRKLSEYRGEKASFYGKRQSQEWKDMISEIMTNNHPMKGRTGDKHHDSKEFIVTFPDGMEVNIKGLAEFCRQNGLNHSAMSSVASGKRKHHKGFVCRKP